MKPLSSFRLSIIIGVIAYIIVSVTLFLTRDSESVNIGQVSLICSLAIFILSLIVLHFFVFRHLNKITDSINATRKYNTHETDAKQDPVTELKKSVEEWADERQSELDQVKKLEAYRKEFLANVSHELKTPMFNIQGYISTLLDGGLEDDKINKDYLQRADKSADRMISIIDDLEAISQLETGELELEKERFDLVPLVLDIFRSQELRATAKAIMLTLSYPHDKTAFVMADRFRIRQVISNLIVNSIKYGKEYGETTVNFVELEDTILVDIQDNGIGIAKEHVPRLFERFYRVDKSRSREQGGTGLGLAIVKHIIEAHGQTISASSTEGVGTTFSFTLKKA